MKEKYFTIVSRDQFINLYRFGSLMINVNFIIHENNIIDLLNLLKCESDEDYLVLKIDCKYDNGTLIDIKTLYSLDINDIKTIYVLSEKAQRYYKPKFNSKIKFEIYDNLEILNQVKLYRELDDINNGIRILAKQFDFIDIDTIEEKLGDDFKKIALANMHTEDYLSLKHYSFILDLLSYKRENFLPKESVGYLFDIIVITALVDRDEQRITKFKQGQLKVETSSSYKKLEANKKDSLLEYIKFIHNNDDSDMKKFIDKVGDINNLIVGAIFLMIKNILVEKNTGYQAEMLQVIDSFSSEYKKQLATALYLIGFIFGYKELYEDYYDFLDLSIFKELNINKEATYDELKEQIKQLKNEKNILEKKENTQEILSTEIISGEGSLLEDPELNVVCENHNATIQQVESSEKDNNIDIEGDNKNSEKKLENNTSKREEKNQKSNIDNLAYNENTEIEFNSLDFIPDNILSLTMMSITDLKKMAKDKGVDKPNSKKYSNDEKGKTALINEILKKSEVKHNNDYLFEGDESKSSKNQSNGN